MRLKLLLPIIGIASLLSSCGGEGSGSPTPLVQITTTASSITQPTPAAPVNNVVDKQKIILGGAISANAPYSFNVTPGDPNLPAWVRNSVGTDYIINKINKKYK